MVNGSSLLLLIRQSSVLGKYMESLRPPTFFASLRYRNKMHLGFKVSYTREELSVVAYSNQNQRFQGKDVCSPQHI